MTYEKNCIGIKLMKRTCKISEVKVVHVTRMDVMSTCGKNPLTCSPSEPDDSLLKLDLQH